MEKLDQERRHVAILVNGTRVEFETHQVTGLEIKTKAGLSPDSELYRKKEDRLTLIPNDERIEIVEGEQFVDFPPTPVS